MTYCSNPQCPFTKCEKHLSYARNETGPISIANFDGVCRKYILWLAEEADRQRRSKNELSEVQ